MKIPDKPPSVKSLLEGQKDILKLLSATAGISTGGTYLHWDQLRFRPPPSGLSREDWWLGLKLNRGGTYQSAPLVDESGEPFRYCLTDPIPQLLHKMDLGAGGSIQMPDQITNPETKDRYYVSSLIEEAITSSQLEGAATTRPVAKEMIRAGRKPRDDSERMILNNYRTMKRIGKLKGHKLTKELVFELHHLITAGTLEDPTAAGRFRTADEKVVVNDIYGTVYHTPPPASQLEERMAAICDFANGDIPKGFVHPVIRSIILHFWLAYDHPFGDGNGRTARALFYWSMLHHNYWLYEFVSISNIILKGPVLYERAFLYTETDDNDLTYFILYHLKVMQRAVKQLHEYIKRKTDELHQLEGELRRVVVLNHRQRVLVHHALRHPNQIYTVQSHQLSNNIVYETARRDLIDLVDRHLLDAVKAGKAWHFTPAADLEKQLIKLS